jgi:hypothetical protein
MKVGYCRVSTSDRTASIAAQRDRFEREGCEKIFSEMTERPWRASATRRCHDLHPKVLRNRLVRAVGVEPTLCQPELDFESSASTSSATPACRREPFALQLPRDSFAALNRAYLPQQRAASLAEPSGRSGQNSSSSGAVSALKVLLTHAFRRRRYGRDAARISPPWVHHFQPKDCLCCTARTRRTPAMFSIRPRVNDAVASQFRVGKDANVRICGFRPLSRAFRASAIARPRAPEVGRDRNAMARGFAQVQAVPPPPRTCARSSRHRGQSRSSARQTSNHSACPRGPRASMKEHA